MSTALRDAQRHAGAVRDDRDRIEHYGDAVAETEAALDSCGVVDRSDRTRLLGAGPDLLKLLNRLSTAHVASLSEGDGASTVLTTPKGRIVERLFVHPLGEPGVLLLGGAHSADEVLEHIRGYTFREQTGLGEAQPESTWFALVGPRVADCLQAAELTHPEPLQTIRVDANDDPAWLIGHDGEATDGVSLFVLGSGVDLWERISRAATTVGGRPIGAAAAEARRVLSGFAASPNELNLEHNPLEAGLVESVDFDKGCYVGQEVVARLHNYDKVSRKLVGLRFPSGAETPAVGARLIRDGRAVGAITSALLPPGQTRPVALAYVKHRDADIGDSVLVEGLPDKTIGLAALPFSDERGTP